MKIGYALYSARDIYNDPKSLECVLREIAKMGYDGVEFFHYAGMSAGDLSALLNDTGLEAPSAHIHMERWIADADGEIEFAARAGIKSLVFPWLAPEYRTNEIYSELARRLPILAQKCANKGVMLQYHNHEFEFEKMNDAYVMDMLLETTGLPYEIDTFWVSYADVDPVEYMRKHSDRIEFVHIKDYSTLNPRPVYCPIGTGKMKNERILCETKRQGKAWLIVELDDCPINPLKAAKISIENIRTAIFRASKKEI